MWLFQKLFHRNTQEAITHQPTLDIPAIRQQLVSSLKAAKRQFSPTVEQSSTIDGQHGTEFELTFPDGTIYHARRYGNIASTNVVLGIHGMLPFSSAFYNQYTDAAALAEMQYWVVDVAPHLYDTQYAWYTPETYDDVERLYLAGFIYRLRKYSGVDKISLEWISKGGYDALHMGAVCSEWFKNIIFISPSGLQEDLEGIWKEHLRTIKNAAAAPLAEVLEAHHPLGLIASKSVWVEESHLSQPVMHIIKKAILACFKDEGIKPLRKSLANIDKDKTRAYITALADTDIATYIVWAENDNITPKETFYDFKQWLHIPDDHAKLFAGGWHAIPLSDETSEEYNALRRKWLIEENSSECAMSHE